MKIERFRAEPDLVGRRARVSWDFVLEGIETLADVPNVTVRRKRRDFAFPAPGVVDPYLVYNSAAFPPAPAPPAVIVAEPAGWAVTEEDGVAHVEVITVATQLLSGAPAETFRRTLKTVTGPGGLPVRLRVELLDLGGTPAGLEPRATYYYQIFSPAIPSGPSDDPAPYRTTVTVGEQYGLNGVLYDSIPAVYRRHDVVTRPPTPGTDGIPEAAGRSGQLRRFTDLFGTGLDLMRSGAEALRGLQDVDQADYRVLPLLAQWIGWKLSYESPVPLQRNEIKSAAALYKGVGTVPALRAIVDRYTGWHTQVAEFEQQIARSNQAPQRNLFAVSFAGGVWRGAEDAAPVLGFLAGNDSAVGGAGTPATLVSVGAEPFALRAGMELTLAADSSLPETVRFGPADFVSIGAATAAEVAAAIDGALPEVRAEAVAGGRVEIRSNTVGGASALQVKPLEATPISLDGAPAGRLSTCRDAAGRLFLAFAAPDTTPAPPGAPLRQRILYKTHAYGRWGNAHTLVTERSVSRAAPAAVALPSAILLAWIENPGSDACAVRAALGVAATPQPAQLVGQRRGPFAIPADARFAFRENGAITENFAFLTTDFADPDHATALEVVTAFNARLAGVTAEVLPNGAVALRSDAAGPDARLEIELIGSANTQALGFAAGNLAAGGAWDDTPSWGPEHTVSVPGPGARYRDLCAVLDGGGVVWLFWSAFDAAAGIWRIVSARQSGGAWTAVEVIAEDGAGNIEPAAVLDSANRIVLLWSRREAVGTPDESWTLRRRVYDPGPATWSAESAVTTVPAGGRVSDGEPALTLDGTGARVFFRSDRGGGTSLWQLTVDAGGVASAPAAVTSGPQADTAPAPAPAPLPGGGLWLLHRSDRGISLARAAAYPLPPTEAGPAPSPPPASAGPLQAGRSLRAPEEATLRRFAGTLSVTPGDLTRNAGRRLWGDLLAYTPQKVMGAEVGPPLTELDLYTPTTLGLYVSKAQRETPITAPNSARLRQLLTDFLPINTRAVVVLAPEDTTELVYSPGADIGESFLDDVPYADYYAGPIESAAAALPERTFLHANTLGEVTANPADLTTLRRRTYAPPPE